MKADHLPGSLMARGLATRGLRAEGVMCRDPEARESKCVQEAKADPVLEQRLWPKYGKSPCRAVE